LVQIIRGAVPRAPIRQPGRHKIVLKAIVRPPRASIPASQDAVVDQRAAQARFALRMSAVSPPLHFIVPRPVLAGNAAATVIVPVMPLAPAVTQAPVARVPAEAPPPLAFYPLHPSITFSCGPTGGEKLMPPILSM